MNCLIGRNRGSWQGVTRIFLITAVAILCHYRVCAGGSGLNVLIVANQASSNSVELANYYRARRHIPPGNVLRIHWSQGNIQWTQQEFTNTLLNPLLEFVSDRNLSQQIQYVALSMDIPYRIKEGTQENSTTAALFYGFKNGAGLSNSYALSERRFETAPPDTAPTNSFLAFMLTAGSLQEAKQLVDQGIESDQAFPASPVWLVKSSDVKRNKRHELFDNAIFNARLCDDYYLHQTNLNSSPPWTNLLGCQLGLEVFTISSNAFVPGAIADSVTSFGGKIFEDPGQTTLLEFVARGASGSYGTVTESGTSPARFPNPMVYFYQARGFSLGECYYQSVQLPYWGLFVGEPLAAPWRDSATGGWTGVTNPAVLQGVTNLSVIFSSGPSGRPVERVDLFIDGVFYWSLTNILPQAGNRLTVRLNNYPIDFTVPPGSDLESIATAFAAQINQAANTNITEVIASAVGDRIELQSLADPLPEGVFEFIDDTATTNTSYLAVPGTYSRASSLSVAGLNPDGSLALQITAGLGVSNVLQASTNLLDWVPVLTNAAGGASQFLETDPSLYARRFYRVAVASPKPTPFLTSMGLSESNGFAVQITAPTNHPYVLQSSSDFRTWTDLSTNSAGGDQQYVDSEAGLHTVRYFRTRSADPGDYAAVVPVGQTPSGGNVLWIQDSAPGGIVVWSSTNGSVWTPIYTQRGSQNVQTLATNSAGGSEPLTTHLKAARPEFLESIARGRRGFAVELDWFATLTDNSWLALEVTKTNEQVTTLSVTNPAGNTDIGTFVAAFMSAVNAHPDLTAVDGLEADDLDEFFPGQKVFDLHARAEGRRAAEMRARLSGSPELSITYKSATGALIAHTSAVALEQNISDLRPRNQLCVSAGSSGVAPLFALDTTTLSDGNHDLTAVAYEGTSVYSQTLRTLPVIISNTPLQAAITLLSASTTNFVDDNFDLQVSANTNIVSEIQLFTTGGFYAGKTNQDTAIFTVSGQDLGVGEHPFHALVTTTNGLSCRTESLTVTLIR